MRRTEALTRLSRLWEDHGGDGGLNTFLQRQIELVQAKAMPASCTSCGRQTTFRRIGTPMCPRCGGTEADEAGEP
jgi:ribosomal protein L37AE/L43A